MSPKTFKQEVHEYIQIHDLGTGVPIDDVVHHFFKADWIQEKSVLDTIKDLNDDGLAYSPVPGRVRVI